MGKPIIRVQGLSKQYRIGARQQGYKTIREALVEAAASPFRRLRSPFQRSNNEVIWALKDVSFEVQPGEVLGIIGRNGAGKSTLLKILSRITEPTEGRAEIRGRVASLLEVGTGFHPELTGRENVYLNGAVMGMTKKEIDRKFDEIVAFAEVEKFIDTPVKRYSSGMYLRLAFAVAAHLEVEILLVDEVLAVGDNVFQERCLGKMRDVSVAGKTVLLVSHNMAAIQILCPKVIHLFQGRISSVGPAASILPAYLTSHMNDGNNYCWRSHPGRLPGCKPLISYAEILDEKGHRTERILLGSAFSIRIHLQIGRPIRNAIVGIGIDNRMGQRIVSFDTAMNGAIMPALDRASIVDCRPLGLLLVPGRYRLKLVLRTPTEDLDVVQDALEFTIQPVDVFGTGLLPDAKQGSVVCNASWNCVPAVTRA